MIYLIQTQRSGGARHGGYQNVWKTAVRRLIGSPLRRFAVVDTGCCFDENTTC